MTLEQVQARNAFSYTGRLIAVRGVGKGKKLCPKCQRIVSGPSRKICTFKDCKHEFVINRRDVFVETSTEAPRTRSKLVTKSVRLYGGDTREVAQTVSEAPSNAKPFKMHKSKRRTRVVELQTRLSQLMAEISTINLELGQLATA